MAVREVGSGVSISFSTKRAEQVAPLRLLLREVAIMIEHQSKLAALHPELVEAGPGQIVLPAVDIDVRDTAAGALVSVSAENLADLEPLRTHARELEQIWRESTCVKETQASARGVKRLRR